jgi:hypothetical protein
MQSSLIVYAIVKLPPLPIIHYILIYDVPECKIILKDSRIDSGLIVTVQTPAKANK